MKPDDKTLAASMRVPRWRSVQEGVDPDVDVDEEPGLTDLDIEPDVDVPAQEYAAVQAKRVARMQREQAERSAAHQKREAERLEYWKGRSLGQSEAERIEKEGPGPAGKRGAPKEGSVRDINAKIYAPHLEKGMDPEAWKRHKDDPEALAGAAEGAAAENYWTTRRSGPEVESGTIGIDGHTWQKNVFRDGSVFFTWPPRREGESVEDYAPSHYLRQRDIKR